MKKFIINVGILFGIFILINALFLLWLVKTDWNFAKRYEAMNFKAPAYEVIVAGNSLALDGIDTDYMAKNGIDAYNIAIAGSGPWDNHIMLKEYLEKCRVKPKKVVLGLAIKNMRKSGPEKLHPIIDFTREDKSYGLGDLPLYKFKWLMTESLKKIISEKHRAATVVRGQLKFSKAIADKSTYKPENTFSPEPYQRAKWVSEIAKLCAEHNIEFIALEMPAKTSLQNFSPIGPYTVKVNDKVSYKLYNFNNAEFCKVVIDPAKDWIGNSHLNQYGAVKFTKEISKYIFKEKQ